MGGPRVITVNCAAMKTSLVLLFALLGFSAASTIPSSRIIGGSNAGSGQFPYMVSLRSAANGHFCGGWIHNTRWIVTAAHCTVGRTLANTVSVVGSVNLGSGGVTIPSASIANHPNFNANTLLNDIALILTSTDIVRTPTVQSIPLSTVNIGSGTTAVITGWGLTALPGYNPDVMQWMSKSTITNASCRLAHSLGNRSRINDSNLCTDNAAGRGNCNGDNGGPLVSGSAVVGVFSWSIPCAQGLPDIYTRVSSYVAWVRMVAGDHALLG